MNPDQRATRKIEATRPELGYSIKDIESSLDNQAHDYCPAAFLCLKFIEISM